MVDGAGRELDRKPDRPLFGELVAMDAQRKPRLRTGGEIAPRLREVEGAAFEEDVGGLGQLRSRGQDLPEREVEIRICVLELGRDGVCAEPGRHAAGSGDRTQ